jgi:hypothetical protein
LESQMNLSFCKISSLFNLCRISNLWMQKYFDSILWCMYIYGSFSV